MRRWQINSMLVLSLLAGGLAVAQASPALAASDNSQTVENKYNDWFNRADSVSVSAVDVTTGKDMTNQLTDKDIDNQKLFKSLRKAFAVYGFHDNMTKDDLQNLSSKAASQILTKDGYLKFLQTMTKGYDIFNVKGYTAVLVAHNSDGNITFYYAPTDKASQYQSLNALAKLNPKVKEMYQTINGLSGADQKAAQTTMTNLMALSMDLLYNQGTATVPGDQSDQFADSSTDDNDDQPASDSSSDKKAAQATKVVKQALAPATTKLDNNNADDGDNDENTGNTDEPDAQSSTDDDNQSLASSSEPNDQNSRDTATPDQVNDRNSSTEPSQSDGQSDSQVANDGNNQSLPQTGNANVVVAMFSGLLTILSGGTLILAKRHQF